MRVLYFSRDYTTHDHRFLVKLAKSRHEIWFLRLEDDGIPYEKRPLPESVRLVNWRGGQQRADTVEAWLRLMPDFESVLDQVSPDLVHAGPVQSCGFMTALSGFRPLLVMSWGSDILADADRDEMWHWITLYTLSRSDMLLCDCQAVRAKVQQWLDYADERIVQFPWGVDLHSFHPGVDSLKLRKRVGWEGKFVILSTRSWERIYGIDVVLDAFRRAYALNPRLRLVLLGYGSLASKVEHFITEHGLDDAVHRSGLVPHEQSPDYFRAADLYISCAHSDGTSISLLEAMATGLPVVVTDGLGNREWVVPGESGWLAPIGDSEAFAQLLLLAADLDVTQRERIRRRNRQIAEERADWDVNSARLLEAYDRIEAQYWRR
jgi:glycosyltransferase involved in cell wall biosynthesis